jgi:LAO/AO transport system kinase
MGLLRPASPSWRLPVLTVSAHTGEGIPAVWDSVLAHRQALLGSGEFEARRRRQTLAWMWSLVDEGLRAAFRAHPAVAAAVEALEREVESQKATPAAAARRLLSAFREV